MFQQFQNIETAFKHVRQFTFVLIIACVALVCFYIYHNDKQLERAENRVLILLNGKVIQAVASSRKENIAVQARDHIRTFHELFFTVSPDEKLIEANMRGALYLADASAKKQYDDLSESGYYSGIISGNVSQRLKTDSIELNLDQRPYYFRYYGIQELVRPTSTLRRTLITEGYLRDVSQSDNNPHGYLIEKWRIIDNRDISMQKR
jgi:conjugative transposon TraK protein